MDNLKTTAANWKPAQSWIAFILDTVAFLWLTHALGFFPHEYAHSFTAWLLGWKSNPLALNYGGLNAVNLLLQFSIDENVDYAPIFSSGHTQQAGAIALAGLFIGNLIITYPLSRWGIKRAMQLGSRTAGLFYFWLCVASVGNLIDYVPVRTFAPHGDMYTLSKGLNCSPWVILIVLGIPFLIILLHFLIFVIPKTLRWLFPQSVARRAIMVILLSMALFGFYGAVGLLETDPISHSISIVSVYVLIPASILLGIWITERSGANKAI